MMHAAAAAVEPFFDKATSTVSYVVHGGPGSRCAVIDPVLDFDAKSGRTRTQSAERIVAFVRAHGLAAEWLLETHVHADHLTAAPFLRRELGGRIGIGAGVVEVQRRFGALFNAGADFRADGGQFDQLFADGDRFSIGGIEGQVLATPGHTPACVSYLVGGDALFVGDTLFMPDGGTARCDFPGGDARVLFRSIRRLLDLPPATRLFVCHDYGPGGRDIAWETTVGEQRRANIHVRDGVGEDEYVAMRAARDRTLEMPALMLPAVQVNMRAGQFPPPEANGISYLKIPVNGI